MSADEHLNQDQFAGIHTSILIAHAHRATPAAEKANWMATTPYEEEAEEFHNLHPDYQRQAVVEQLEHYGIDRNELNRRRS